MALTFTAEYMSIDSEYQLFRILPSDRRKRRLFFQIEMIRRKLTARLTEGENCFIVDSMGIDSEHQLFRTLPSDLHNVIERSVYNRRKRRLFFYLEMVRQKLAVRLGQGENCFIVDCMPLEVCKLSRSQRSKICKEIGPHAK